MRVINKDEDAESVYLLGVDFMMKEGLTSPSCLSYFLIHFQIWIYHVTHI